jgi:acetolactate synthase-1/2/3 large subunit
MSAGDLATVSRIGGPTVLILFNNGCYGWIKALQKLYKGGRYFSVDMCESLDYVGIANGFGLPALRVEDPEHVGSALDSALESSTPFLIEIVTAAQHEAIPPVAPWRRAVEQQALRVG